MLLAWLLIAFHLNGQIDKEIRAFIDSTEVLAGNGRKMIEAKIMEGNMEKAAEVYDYLTALTAGKPLATFNYREDVWLNLLFRRWEKLAEILAGYSELINRRTNVYYSQILIAADERLHKDEQALRAGYMNSGLDGETLDLLDILFHAMLNGGRNNEYNSLLDNFRKRYPGSRYNDVVKGFLPGRYNRVALSFGMGPGLLLPTDNLGLTIGNGMTGNLSFELLYGRLLASLYFQSGAQKLRVPFEVTQGTELLSFHADEKFEYFEAGLRAGYLMVRGSRVNLAPFVTLGGASLQSMRYDSSLSDLEYKAINSFMYGPGLRTEVRLSTFGSKFYSYTEIAYISMKLEGGWNLFATSNHVRFRGSMPWASLALVFGIGEF